AQRRWWCHSCRSRRRKPDRGASQCPIWLASWNPLCAITRADRQKCATHERTSHEPAGTHTKKVRSVVTQGVRAKRAGEAWSASMRYSVSGVGEEDWVLFHEAVARVCQLLSE